MSDAARRVLVLRYWLEAMEEKGASSSYAIQQVYITEPKLRDAADFVIQWGC
ncbi:hypothetical protein [Acidovorax sp.]|uniref:hypothetical protein n=1 Tax=Acidovorax sp. TaxID=1872122 RepID=UPI0025B7AD9F|nr:hypothetical protein [Acidovorax sp.]